MKPGLTRIRRIAVITTYGSEGWIAALVGDCGRKFMSSCLRTLCHPDCQLLWLGIYGVGGISRDAMEKHFLRIQSQMANF